MKEIERRTAATLATQARFADKPFDWSKSATCIHLVRFHAAQMGYKLPVVPKFRTALGAMKALKKTGFDSLPDLLDAYFVRVPPAMLRVGDVMAIPGTDSFDALVIRGGIDKFLGWHEDAAGCTVVRVPLDKATGAWRL
jgi:hypothetical protein